MRTPNELYKGFNFQLRGEIWEVRFVKSSKELRLYNAAALCKQRARKIVISENPDLAELRRVFWHEWFHSVCADLMDNSEMEMTGLFFEELAANLTSSAVIELLPQLLHFPKCLVYDTEEV